MPKDVIDLESYVVIQISIKVNLKYLQKPYGYCVTTGLSNVSFAETFNLRTLLSPQHEQTHMMTRTEDNNLH